MEGVSLKNAEAVSLFQAYDKAGVGEISKQVLLTNFAMIDARINENWLNKILLEHGVPLKPYITCAHFIQIMNVLATVSDHSASQGQS